MITWTSTTGYSVAGSCEYSCTAVTVSLTGTTSTVGTTCSSTVLGNTYSFPSCWEGATNQAGITECSAFNCKVLKIIITLNILIKRVFLNFFL